MPIIDTITDDYHFAEWCKQARNRDSDYGHFNFEQANAVQAYFEQLSDDTGENIEFDPIAWCVEFTAYDNLHEFNRSYWGEDYANGENFADLDELRDETTVIEADDGSIIVGEF